jgi:histidine triad (HIT) family protein
VTGTLTSMATDQDCLFCKIVAGDVPGDVVHETETTLAFRDIEPQAPTHVLVIPRSHHPNVAELSAKEPDTAVDLLNAVAAIADQEGLGDGYRLVFNTGAQAHQTVFHVHAHVLGGRTFGWPPG